MRFGRSIAVTVLATGLIGAGAAKAAGPEPAKPPAPVEPAKPAPAPVPSQTDEPKYPPVQARKVDTSVWKPAVLKQEHGVLQALAGKFTTKVHVYSGPYARMNDTEGVADGKILLGGAFVEVTHAEKRMKEAFDGQMIFGFDVATGKFVADSISSASTAIVRYVGTFDAAKKQINLTAHFSDEKKRFLTISRVVITLVDAKSWTYDEYESNKAGDPETQVVTIAFTR